MNVQAWPRSSATLPRLSLWARFVRFLLLWLLPLPHLLPTGVSLGSGCQPHSVPETSAELTSHETLYQQKQASK